MYIESVPNRNSPAAVLLRESYREDARSASAPWPTCPACDVLAVYPSSRHLSAKVRVTIDFPADAFRCTPPWDRDAAPRSAPTA